MIMKSHILKHLNKSNMPIILVLNKNSNPDQFVINVLASALGRNISCLSNNLPDFIMYDGAHKSIKKEDILNIINQFSYSGVDNNNIKIYYLKNCEYASIETFNTLLKFLEEPSGNTLGILTTSSLTLLPNTICSRCNICYLESDTNLIDALRAKYHLDKYPWILKLFNDVAALDEFCLAKYFPNFIDMHNFFLKPNLSIYIDKFNEFKNWDFSLIKLFLQSLILVVPTNKQTNLLKLLEDMNVNPVRPLLFLQIFKIMEMDYV